MWALRSLRTIVTTDVGSGLNIKSLFSASYASPSTGSLTALSPSHTPPSVPLALAPVPSSSMASTCGTSRRLSNESLESIAILFSNLKGQERSATELSLVTLLKGLPESLLRQYEYEDPLVRGGKHLMHSQFFKVFARLFIFHHHKNFSINISIFII